MIKGNDVQSVYCFVAVVAVVVDVVVVFVVAVVVLIVVFVVDDVVIVVVVVLRHLCLKILSILYGCTLMKNFVIETEAIRF